MAYPKRSLIRQVLSDGGWVPLPFLAVGLLVMAGGIYLLSHAWALYMAGVHVQGQVERLWTTVEDCSDKDHSHKTCVYAHVAYVFDAGGPLTHDSTTVQTEFYDSLTEGGPIAVTYARGNPALNEVEQGKSLLVGLILIGFGLVFAAVGGVTAAVQLGEVRAANAQRDRGVQRQAVVTGKLDRVVDAKGGTLGQMRWRDDSGAEGESGWHSPGDLPAVGATITVYIDPNGKRPPVWEGDSGTR